MRVLIIALLLSGCNLLEVLEEEGCPESELPVCPDDDGDGTGYCESIDDLVIVTDVYYVTYDKDYGVICQQNEHPEGYSPAIWGQDCDDTDPLVQEGDCFWPEEVCYELESDYEAVYGNELDCAAGTIDYE